MAIQLLIRADNFNSQLSIPALTFLLKNSANPNTASVVTCEEGSSTAYTTSCDKQIAELLIKAGSKYAIDGLTRKTHDQKF